MATNPGRSATASKLRKLQIELNIPAQRYVELYAGAVKDVYAVSREGVSIRFPGKYLNRFVTSDGIYGTFTIHFDGNNKLVNIQRIN